MSTARTAWDVVRGLALEVVLDDEMEVGAELHFDSRGAFGLAVGFVEEMRELGGFGLAWGNVR